jgi:hypothetical protein
MNNNVGFFAWQIDNYVGEKWLTLKLQQSLSMARHTVSGFKTNRGQCYEVVKNFHHQNCLKLALLNKG